MNRLPLFLAIALIVVLMIVAGATGQGWIAFLSLLVAVGLGLWIVFVTSKQSWPTATTSERARNLFRSK